MLALEMPFDVNVLKVDVPADATAETPWEVTRVSRQNYYDPERPLRTAWEQSLPLGYTRAGNPAADPPDTDIHALRVKGVVSVTPISLDLTSRIPLAELDLLLRVQ
jgi:5'-nucleotidase